MPERKRFFSIDVFPKSFRYMGHFSMFLILIFNLRLKIILLMIIRGQWYPVLNPNSFPKISNLFYFLHISWGMEHGGWYRRRKITNKSFVVQVQSYKKGAGLSKKWNSAGARILKWLKIQRKGAKTGGGGLVQNC